MDWSVSSNFEVIIAVMETSDSKLGLVADGCYYSY